jgi:hypothetical protein
MAEAKLKYASPWVIYYRRIEALFKHDPEVDVTYNEEDNEIKILVKNDRKYDAICVLFPVEKRFGNVTFKITVIPSNDDTEPTWSDLFNDAFGGNPIFSYAEHVDTSLGTFDYIVFNEPAAQYFSDNLSDIRGVTTELYQDIAKEIFDTGKEAVCFCTDVLE